jgi:hypothetical protein
MNTFSTLCYVSKYILEMHVYQNGLWTMAAASSKRVPYISIDK